MNRLRIGAVVVPELSEMVCVKAETSMSLTVPRGPLAWSMETNSAATPMVLFDICTTVADINLRGSSDSRNAGAGAGAEFPVDALPLCGRMATLLRLPWCFGCPAFSREKYANIAKCRHQCSC